MVLVHEQWIAHERRRRGARFPSFDEGGNGVRLPGRRTGTPSPPISCPDAPDRRSGSSRVLGPAMAGPTRAARHDRRASRPGRPSTRFRGRGSGLVGVTASGARCPRGDSEGFVLARAPGKVSSSGRSHAFIQSRRSGRPRQDPTTHPSRTTLRTSSGTQSHTSPPVRRCLPNGLGRRSSARRRPTSSHVTTGDGIRAGGTCPGLYGLRVPLPVAGSGHSVLGSIPSPPPPHGDITGYTPRTPERGTGARRALRPGRQRATSSGSGPVFRTALLQPRP